MRSAIFDNTVFNIAARIQSCDLILLATNLFEGILIPQEISSEINNFPTGKEFSVERRMQQYYKLILSEKHVLELCTTLDPVVFSVLSTQNGVHKGEAEAIAQAQKRSVFLFFTDDFDCILNVKPLYPNIRFVSTFFLIALLDIEGLLPDYQYVMKEFLAFRPLPSNTHRKKLLLSQWRLEYQAAMKHYSLQVDKKIISDKTSFKQIIK